MEQQQQQRSDAKPQYMWNGRHWIVRQNGKTWRWNGTRWMPVRLLNELAMGTVVGVVVLCLALIAFAVVFR